MDILKDLMIFIFAFASFGFVLSRIFKRNDIADINWGLGFILIAAWQAMGIAELSFKAKFVLVLVSLWGLRLAIYLFVRMQGKPEDVRYLNWRKEWGSKEPLIAFGKVYLLQSILLAIIAIPLVFLMRDTTTTVGPFDFAGFVLFCIGLIFEGIADAQMYMFKKGGKNKGKILDQGLWAFCRHPNYFGEILIWWGLYAFTLGSPHWMASLISPILITFLILKVSGVTMLEEHLSKRGEDFKNYVKNTPAILPFGTRGLFSFFKVVVSILILDMIWLGNGFNQFYVEQSALVARIKDGGFDVLPWAVLMVYICIPLGVCFFGVMIAKTRLMALFYGAFFGLMTYTIYEFTNLSLIKNWPWEMALLDIGWGPLLFGMASMIGFTYPKKESV